MVSFAPEGYPVGLWCRDWSTSKRMRKMGLVIGGGEALQEVTH
jgi:hypothetical protein